jgi:methionyl-tRNA formyltransferase
MGVREVTPEPGAFTILDDARLKILDAVIAREEPRIEAGRLELRGGRVLVGTGSDPLEIVTVHPAGKKPMNATDWWRGRTADAGTVAR